MNNINKIGIKLTLFYCIMFWTKINTNAKETKV